MSGQHCTPLQKILAEDTRALQISNGLGRLWHFHSAKWIDGADIGLQQSHSSAFNIWTKIIWGLWLRSNCIKRVSLILFKKDRFLQIKSNQIKGLHRHVENCKFEKTFHSTQTDIFHFRVLTRKRKEIKAWVSSLHYWWTTKYQEDAHWLGKSPKLW